MFYLYHMHKFYFILFLLLNTYMTKMINSCFLPALFFVAHSWRLLAVLIYPPSIADIVKTFFWKFTDSNFPKQCRSYIEI
jgi:hypothetical protein